MCLLNSVLRFNQEAMVIECKRVKQTSWVFLIPKPELGQRPSQRYHARLWETKYTDGEFSKFDWRNWAADPSSFESMFCAIPGQDRGRQNLLERIAAELTEAIEVFAFHDRICRTAGYNYHLLYIPVIVTTANLVISYFDPKTISLEDGNLPPDSHFEIVPVVRFRKSLTTEVPSLRERNIQEVHDMTQRTVFIVNAARFHEFLENWNIRV